jgi:hypothetical protein
MDSTPALRTRSGVTYKGSRVRKDPDLRHAAVALVRLKPDTTSPAPLGTPGTLVTLCSL